jgi:tetratricopeptide (TPR) repeat protein
MDALPQIIIYCILGAFIVCVLIFVIKSVATPKRIEGIQKLLKQGKPAAAQKLAKSMIAKNPRDYVAHYWLGESYYADGKIELAFMEFKLVNQNAIFNGDIPELIFRKKIAGLYLKFNQQPEALKEYLLLSKMEPHNADNDYNVGKIYEAQGRADLALGFYQKAVSVNKGHSQAHAAMGYLLFRSKQYGEAKKEIDYAIQLSPETYSNYYFQGKILKDNQDYSAALSAFERGERDPEYRQRCLIERGACYMAGNSVDNAIGEFEHAVKCSKDEESQETLYSRYFLASCYEKTRQIDKAISQWEKIAMINHNFRDVNAKLSEYRDLQSNDSMKEYLTSASDKFIEICKKAANKGFSLQATSVEPTKYGCTMLATEVKTDNWMTVRQQAYLVEFYRDSEPIEDDVIRRIADKVKKQNYAKAIVCASGGFTRSATSFAENRPVELVEKERLENILAQAGI